MTTDPFDTDATFDAPLAHETPAAPPLASSAAPGGFGQRLAGMDGRREHRVRVTWPARVQLPGGQVVEMRARDLSEGGVGLASPRPLPVNAVLNFALGAPDLEDLKKIAPITGTLRVLFVVLAGADYQVGAVWQQISDVQRDVVARWVRRQRR